MHFGNEQGDVQKGLPADDATGEEIALLDTLAKWSYRFQLLPIWKSVESCRYYWKQNHTQNSKIKHRKISRNSIIPFGAMLDNVNPQPLYQIIVLQTPELCMRNLPLNWKISTKFFFAKSKKEKKKVLIFLKSLRNQTNTSWLFSRFTLKREARKIASDASKQLKALRKPLSHHLSGPIWILVTCFVKCRLFNFTLIIIYHNISCMYILPLLCVCSKFMQKR